ncbi:MAG: 2-dehydropantoate 2-reductase N-terminal domain-containing protein [Bacteroides uniformis]
MGCTYGWQLSKAGCDVAVLVRKEQKELVQKRWYSHYLF